MSATAGGRRRDDVRLVLHVGMDGWFFPLRNAYAERCVRGGPSRCGGKARTLTQRTRRKAENTEKDNGKPTATAARFDETEPAATESTPRAGGHFSAGCLISTR